MIEAQARCAVCNVVLPIAKSGAIAWTSGLAVGGLGVAATKSVWGKILMAGVGLATVALVDHLARPLCGGCRVG